MQKLIEIFCEIYLILTDKEPPVFQEVPNDIAQYIDPPQSATVVNWVEPTATDNAGEVILKSNHKPGDNFTVGFTNVTYTAIDESGNEAVISFGLEVIISGISI